MSVPGCTRQPRARAAARRAASCRRSSRRRPRRCRAPGARRQRAADLRLRIPSGVALTTRSRPAGSLVAGRHLEAREVRGQPLGQRARARRGPRRPSARSTRRRPSPAMRQSPSPRRQRRRRAPGRLAAGIRCARSARTNPSPSNRSPCRRPSGKRRTALHEPASRTAGDASSTQRGGRHLVRHRDQRAADVGQGEDRSQGRPDSLRRGIPSARPPRRCRPARSTGCRSAARRTRRSGTRCGRRAPSCRESSAAASERSARIPAGRSAPPRIAEIGERDAEGLACASTPRWRPPRSPPNVMPPTISGTFGEPGGATTAKSAGSSAVTVVPRFCAMAIAVTRVRAGNSSGIEAREHRVVALIDDAPHEERERDRQRHVADADGLQVAEREQAGGERAGDDRRPAADAIRQMRRRTG